MNFERNKDKYFSVPDTLLRDEIDIVTAFQPPCDDVEATVASIWAVSLGLDKVGRNDDFFDLGGDSYAATEIAFGIEERFQLKFAPASIIDHSTITRQAALIVALLKRPTNSLIPSCLVGYHIQGNRPPVFLIHGASGFTFSNKLFLGLLGSDQPIYLFHVPGFDGTAPGFETLDELAAIYIAAMQSVQPQGPYNIASICNGAFIGLEMCIGLEERDEKVKNLILIDPSQVPEMISNRYPPTSKKNWQWLGLMQSRILRPVARVKNIVGDLVPSATIEQSWQGSTRSMEKRRSRVRRKIHRLRQEGKISEEEMKSRTEDLISSHLALKAANKNYAPRRAYKGHAHILVNNVYGSSTIRDDLFWRAHLGSFDYEMGPGTHLDFFSKNIHLVAAFLKRHLAN